MCRLLFSVLLFASALAQAADFSNYLVVFDRLTAEMKRLDGEGLLVRENRQPWANVLTNLRSELANARDLAEVSWVFAKLDASYTNLHTRIKLGEELAVAQQHLTPSVEIKADWISAAKTVFRVSHIHNGMNFKTEAPQVGDYVIAINGKSMGQWSDLNFNFCKFALREQCDVNLFDKFVGRLISFHEAANLEYELKRGDKVWKVKIPLIQPPKMLTQEKACGHEANRYDGFKRTYEGRFACVYESATGVAILRITSFQYSGISKSEPIHSVDSEVQHLFEYWKTHATWPHLVIDVIENYGGNELRAYYEILLDRPFQEQYYRLKKIPELLVDRNRLEMFWGNPAQELWFQKILRNGVFLKTGFGDFLPHTPMFCVDGNLPCDEGVWNPVPHPFKGRVSILVNEWCVSSCDAFVFTLKEYLGD